MATDYSKKTNPELVEILKSRSLPHTGKKADLISRLQQDDESKPADAATAPAAAKTDTAEDVIDWDDEPTETAVKPSSEAGAAAIAAGGQGAVPNPVAVPNQKLDEDPATTDDLKVESTGAATEVAAQPEAPAQPEAAVEEKPAVDYTRGLPATELEAELQKRKARAEKFGIIEDSETALKEATKQVERAKRFGTGAEVETTPGAGVSRLDQALPDERSRKRGREARADQSGRGGKKRDTGRNRNQRRGDGNRNRDGGNRTNAGVKKPNAGNGNAPKNWSEKDNAAMEARKKRFAAAA
jgi:SAP domain-containing ribonucleoprotein